MVNDIGINTWMNASLKRWAMWTERQRDKSMGWYKESPMFKNAGMPRTGKVYDMHIGVSSDEESERLHFLIHKHLTEHQILILKVYYIKSGKRRNGPPSFLDAGRMLGMTDKTVKKHLVFIADLLSKRLEDTNSNADTGCKPLLK